MYDEWNLINFYFKYESILLIFIALGEYLVHFPQGLKLWLGSFFGKSHNSLYKLNHDAYETLKRSLTHTHTLFIYSSDFGIICEAISGNYPGGIGAPIC